VGKGVCVHFGVREERERGGPSVCKKEVENERERERERMQACAEKQTEKILRESIQCK
jgi:hypothetical protein